MPDAVAVLTPWDRGSKLPTPSDLTRIAGLTPSAFLTSAPRYKKMKSRMSVVDRTIREMGAKLTAVEPPTGYVRLRTSSGGSPADWNCLRSPEAVHVT